MNLEQMKADWRSLYDQAVKALEDDDLEKHDELKAQMDPLKERIDKLEELKANAPPDPRQGLPIAPDTPPAPEPTEAEVKAAELKTVHILKYGDIDEQQDNIMRQVYGGAYLEQIVQQDEDFKTYIRTGKKDINHKYAQRQMWDAADVMDMLKTGMYVAEIKATMTEGTDVLGGYAVPPQRARAILREAQGLVAVRQAGAMVIRTSSNMIEWLKITGATKGSYPSALRGSWGGESQSPDETNLTFGLEQIPVHLYTYKVPISMSLLQDATNIMPVLNRIMAETMAIDENIEFISGTGEKAPRGIMPGDVPDTTISDLGNVLTSTTGSGTFDIEDYKGVRRSIASVYRMAGRAGYIFNSSTANFVENMRDSEGRFYFTSVGLGENTFGSPTRETEAMPDIGSSTYPIIYGDAIGYAIVERLGLAIVRFQDSNTGINVVEFHLRRRIGGRVVEPYRFAALRCSA